MKEAPAALEFSDVAVEQGSIVYRALHDSIARVLRGQERGIRWLLAAFVAGGHALIEDVPGTGKTTLAKALAASLDMQFTRIQFTPDLLPSDILGVSIYDQRLQAFHFHPGPIFTQILLADEVNRASPRTQSALLEAMAEGQVTAEGRVQPLDGLFFVIATQNPVEFHGTYPLPEAQMDRFAIKFSLGYVEPADEVRLLSDQLDHHPLRDLVPCARGADVLRLRELAKAVRVSEGMKRYMVELAAATRKAAGVRLGASPRASISLMKLSQALALFEGRGYATPDHVQELAPAVLAHRLCLDSEANLSGRSAASVVEDVLRRTPLPG